MAAFKELLKPNLIKEQESIKTKSIGCKIAANSTDIVITEYSDRIFIIITQYQKIGSLLTVLKETAKGDHDIYQVKTILGQEDEETHLAARYLTEQTKINKPVLYSICLKDCSLPTLKALKEIINLNKFW